MKVRALRTGFIHGSRKKEGQEFEIHDVNEFSPNWMESIDFVPPAGKDKPTKNLGDIIRPSSGKKKSKEDDNKPMAMSTIQNQGREQVSSGDLEVI